jgi:hypothetical protein
MAPRSGLFSAPDLRAIRASAALSCALLLLSCGERLRAHPPRPIQRPARRSARRPRGPTLRDESPCAAAGSQRTRALTPPPALLPSFLPLPRRPPSAACRGAAPLQAAAPPRLQPGRQLALRPHLVLRPGRRLHHPRGLLHVWLPGPQQGHRRRHRRPHGRRPRLPGLLRVRGCWGLPLCRGAMGVLANCAPPGRSTRRPAGVRAGAEQLRAADTPPPPPCLPPLPAGAATRCSACP